MDIDPALFRENERLSPKTDERKFVDIGTFGFESGEEISNVRIAYETWGELEGKGENAILVCHALTGDSHAVGWWDRLVGPGKAIDTNRFFVICTNCLGGCQGSTGPSSLAPDGKPYGSRFPAVTLGDTVEAMRVALQKIGVERLLMICGGSMGGMQALEWTLRFPGTAKKAWLTAACAAHNASQIGFNEAQRQAVMRDPKWRGGDYPLDDPPVDGLAVARMIAHLMFLSEASMDAKFGRKKQESPLPIGEGVGGGEGAGRRPQVAGSIQNPKSPEGTPGLGRSKIQNRRLDSPHPSSLRSQSLPLKGGGGNQFEVESYLNYQGDKFVKRFDANSFIWLTRAMNEFERRSLKGSSSEYLFTSFASDRLYPPYQSEELQELAKEAGVKSRWVDIDLPYGHDAFLLDGERQGEEATAFLEVSSA